MGATENDLDLMDVDEVAAMVRLRKGTIYRYTSERRIPYFKIGNRVVFNRSDITAWLVERRRSVQR